MFVTYTLQFQCCAVTDQGWALYRQSYWYKDLPGMEGKVSNLVIHKEIFWQLHGYVKLNSLRYSRLELLRTVFDSSTSDCLLFP